MIVVGATTAPYLLDGERELRWLRNAEAMQEATPTDVRYFLALEHRTNLTERHVRGVAASEPLLDRLEDVAGDCWRFSIDDDERELSGLTRLVRICTGRNLVTEYAVRHGATHILYLDADIVVPPDAIVKLLELDWPLVGGDVPSYCLSGPPVEYPFPVQRHWNTAGFLLVMRSVFTRLRWRHDPDENLTDDPAYATDALAMLGLHTFVRKDVIGEHDPLVPLERRGLDLHL